MRDWYNLGYADGLRAKNKLAPIAYPYRDKYSAQEELIYLSGYNNAKPSNTLMHYADER
jgi:hypothetical protein